MGKESHNVRNSGSLLTNSDVNAIERFAVIASLVDFLLVDDGINSNSGLSGLSVSNDQFTLSSANWNLLN